MSLKCGLVGLPNVGKSSLFNALTNSHVAAENFAFCTIDPHMGIVEVPDERLAQLAAVVKPQRIVPTTIEFTDIAGLVQGASKGEGLGNQFLAHVRETDAIAHLLRCFKNEAVTHVHNKTDPLHDLQIINTELCIADLTTAENSLQKHERKIKSGDKEAIVLTALLKNKVLPVLSEGKFLREATFTKEEKETLKSFGFLTMKPTIYVLNISDEPAQNINTDAIEDLARKEGSQTIKLNIKLEAELSELGPEDRAEFLAASGENKDKDTSDANSGEKTPQEDALGGFIRCCYALLNLHTFFTAGPKELRAWTIPRGTTALAAAGKIHNDFIKHFIRAEVIAFDRYIECGGEQPAKAKGHLRLEGKDYVVADGDLVYFRTSA